LTPRSPLEKHEICNFRNFHKFSSARQIIYFDSHVTLISNFGQVQTIFFFSKITKWGKTVPGGFDRESFLGQGGVIWGQNRQGFVVRLNSKKFQNINFKPKLSFLMENHNNDLPAWIPRFLRIHPIYDFLNFSFSIKNGRFKMKSNFF